MGRQASGQTGKEAGRLFGQGILKEKYHSTVDLLLYWVRFSQFCK